LKNRVHVCTYRQAPYWTLFNVERRGMDIHQQYIQAQDQTENMARYIQMGLKNKQINKYSPVLR